MASNAKPHNYEEEWRFNKDNKRAPPELCLAMSGGGIRSAAFNMGVLRALHEKKILDRIDVVSAVSGGSYTLSWLLLEPYYIKHYAQPGEDVEIRHVLNNMFDVKGRFQEYLAANARQFSAVDSVDYYMMVGLTTFWTTTIQNALRLVTQLGDERHFNSSSERREYRESIQRTFQGLPDPTSNFWLKIRNKLKPLTAEHIQQTAELLDLTIVEPAVSFLQLRQFVLQEKLPFFIFNTTVKPTEKSASASRVPLSTVFELTPLTLGSDSYGYTRWDDLKGREFVTISTANVAPAISGAALSRSSKAVSALNIDLGYFVPSFNKSHPGSIYLSDGGYSDNLGLYSLVRRHCRNIIAVDAEHDPSYGFSSYRRLKESLKAELDVELEVPLIDKKKYSSQTPVLKGTVTFPRANSSPPTEPVRLDLLYIKLSMSDKEAFPQVVEDYARDNPKFPQQSTVDQNFDPDQFIAYRELGYALTVRSKSLR
jgi:hypothetical protein